MQNRHRQPVILSKENIDQITSDRGAYKSNKEPLPVKVIQFGTGVLLRGLPDYLIDKANRQGIFNGKIIAVKSTEQGKAEYFKEQDCLYTVLIRGIQDGGNIDEVLICESLADVFSATREWEKILAEAHNPELTSVISNTTEIGIQLVLEDISLSPPKSFPGKLLAFMHERYTCFKGSSKAGLIIIPTELLPNNGDLLKEIVLKLSEYNKLSDKFIDWLSSCNSFCNSLVDRIVPGKLDDVELAEFMQKYGYQDQLMITAEPYLLWAIEGNQTVRKALSFSSVHPGVVICDNIDAFRELKLRLLNGTHSLLCGLAVLCVFDTVKNALDNDIFRSYTMNLMKEIAESIPYSLDKKQINSFEVVVLERFQNPFIQHLWLNICGQYTLKLKTRVIPLLKEYYIKFNKAPEHIAMGLAAYIIFMKSERRGEEFYGNLNGGDYLISDAFSSHLHRVWKETPIISLAEKILSDVLLWGENLSILPNLALSVQGHIELFLEAYPRGLLLEQLA